MSNRQQPVEVSPHAKVRIPGILWVLVLLLGLGNWGAWELSDRALCNTQIAMAIANQHPGALGAIESLDRAQDLTFHPYAPVRSSAAKLLGEAMARHESVVACVVALLDDDHEFVIVAAIEALAQSSSPPHPTITSRLEQIAAQGTHATGSAAQATLETWR